MLRHIGADHVIVDPGQDIVDMSKVFTLNDTAAWLWEQLLGQDFTAETMVELLAVQYEVSKVQAEGDTRKLIESFQKNGLLDRGVDER